MGSGGGDPRASTWSWYSPFMGPRGAKGEAETVAVAEAEAEAGSESVAGTGAGAESVTVTESVAGFESVTVAEEETPRAARAQGRVSCPTRPRAAR